jgi:hypothetical protein
LDIATIEEFEMARPDVHLAVTIVECNVEFNQVASHFTVEAHSLACAPVELGESVDDHALVKQWSLLLFIPTLTRYTY